MQANIVTRPQEFAALKPAWDRLHARAAPRDLFLAHEWFDAAWQWCGRDAQLHVVCCMHDGELAGALPLVLRRTRHAGVATRTLEFLAVPDTQRCDLVADAAQRDGVASAVAAALARSGTWDVIRMRHLPADAAAIAALGPALRAHRLHPVVAAAGENPRIPLDATWEAYYATRTRSLKKAVNLAGNRIARGGEVAIEWLEPGTGTAADVDRVVAAMTSISARSWKHATGNSLEHPGPQAFVTSLARLAHARGWLSAWVLSLAGTPVAMELQLVNAGDVFALRSDFDAALDEISPGSHLNRQMLEALFGRGLAHYYMGPGDNRYKYRWAVDATPVQSMTVYGRSALGRALRAWELSLKPLARRVRDRMRPAAPAEAPASPDAPPAAP